MPAGDGTGPRGMGPMTGRGAGYCAGYSAPGYANPMPGRGFGMGRGGGRGRGWRHMYYATGLPGWARLGRGYGYWPPEADTYPPPASAVSPQQEAQALKNQVKYMEESIHALNERIRELETQPAESEE